MDNLPVQNDYTINEATVGHRKRYTRQYETDKLRITSRQGSLRRANLLVPTESNPKIEQPTNNVECVSFLPFCTSRNSGSLWFSSPTELLTKRRLPRSYHWLFSNPALIHNRLSDSLVSPSTTFDAAAPWPLRHFDNFQATENESFNLGLYSVSRRVLSY